MWASEPRRLRLGAVAVLGIWTAGTAVAEILFYLVPPLGVLLVLALVLLPLSVVVLAGFLVRNGFQMLRREGRSLGNLLSLLTGIALVALPALALLLVSTRNPVALGAASLAFFVSAQLGLSFLTFLAFTLLYAGKPVRPGPDAVVVLGAGLVRGKVGPLLASRLERGRLARDEQLPQLTADDGAGPAAAAGALVPIITSGGRGDDEPRSEAAAMAEYLVEHGVPAEQVLLEDQSRTTEQNLIFSRRVADEVLPVGVAPGHLLVATNSYHAPRAALLSCRLGIDADVVGGRAATYYVPSAYLREFVAVMVMNKRTQLLLAVPGLLLSVGLTALLTMAG